MISGLQLFAARTAQTCSPSYRLSLDETTGDPTIIHSILSLRKLNNLNRLSCSPKIDAQTRHCLGKGSKKKWEISH